MKFPFEKIDPLFNSGSLYFHFPFCRSKCYYCAFLSRPAQTPAQIEAQLDQTAILAGEFFQRFPLFVPTSLYFGGGTPSLVPVDTLRRWSDQIFSSASFFGEISNGTTREWTIEANCQDITKENLNGWASMGINRISLGIQSLRQDVLDRVGRKVTVAQQQTALELLSDYWGDLLQKRWSLDLIAGLPGYSTEMFISDLHVLLSGRDSGGYNFGHISIYDLILEEGTPLFDSYRKTDQNGSHDQENNELADLWDAVKEILSDKGFSRYEISNFSKSGEESFHNCQYWEMRPYLGLGEGAVSMLSTSEGDVFRLTQQGQVLFDREEISRNTYKKEFLMMGLRTRFGVDLIRFKEIFGVSVNSLIPRTLNRYVDLFKSGNSTPLNFPENKYPQERLALTDRGLDILNSILLLIFEELDKNV